MSPYDKMSAVAACSPSIAKSDETFTRRVLNSADVLRETLWAAENELRELLSRNHGPTAETGNDMASKTLDSSGRFQEVETTLHSLQDLADRVRSLARQANQSH